MRLLFSSISAIEIAERALELALLDQVARPLVEIVGAVVGRAGERDAPTPAGDAAADAGRTTVGQLRLEAHRA